MSTLDATYCMSRLTSNTVLRAEVGSGVELAKRTELVEVLPEVESFLKVESEMEVELEAESEMVSELGVVSELENRVFPDRGRVEEESMGIKASPIHAVGTHPARLSPGVDR
ncbi:hypothetical protein JB92DRAFT_2829773 [Gautieria morchelliformis]|nr:hypothetical protein JB92DRAFT_2829773 [Gautieria morchelliformis]